MAVEEEAVPLMEGWVTYWMIVTVMGALGFQKMLRAATRFVIHYGSVGVTELWGFLHRGRTMVVPMK